MKNSVICKNCSAENPVYSHICDNCKYYIRDRVVNIDIWETIGKIIESPSEAFKKIIFAEHKNFIVFLLLIFGLRILILSRFISLILSDNNIATSSLLSNYLISLISVAFLLLLLSFFTSVTLNKYDYRVRLKDILSLNVYANIPNYFATTFIFIIELVVFGEYLFSNNPNPFQIKPTIAYVFLFVESGMMIWSILLNYKAMHSLTSKKILSSVLTLINYFFIAGLIILLAVTIFFF